ncbi:ATP-binding protein, partial [Methanocaldococcus sp.]
YLNTLLLAVKKSGKKPILIFDELQMIKDVVLNGQKYLLKELFQFLVSLTKEQHLCHVFCLSSDSLFIEYIYNTGELEERADYILVDDFDKETALKFMDFLSDNILNKKLSEEEKELIYSYVGGKPVLIIKVINKMKTEELDKILNFMLDDAKQKLKYFLENIREENEELYKEIIKALKIFKENYKVKDITINKKVREFLVKKNILFLDPINGILKPQSFLVWRVIKCIL